MKDEKQYTDGIAVKESKFLAWFDNYWYHYKWVTIVVAFFLVVFSICIIQSCTNKPADILVTYAGPVSLNVDEKANIERVFSRALPDDFSKSDNAYAGLSSF